MADDPFAIAARVASALGFIAAVQDEFHVDAEMIRNAVAEHSAIRFATAEDTLLYKLVWCRLGGEQSERQWSDVLGVIKVQADRLDRPYLRRWARHLKVTDLLDRALS